MGILDWFKNRPAQFDPDTLSDAMTLSAIEKAVTLVNPRLKLVPAYQERLAPAVETSIRYLREMVLAPAAAIDVSVAHWSIDANLRAFFVAAADIPAALSRSRDLRTLFEKYPQLDAAYFILGMTFNEQLTSGMSLQGEIVQRDVTQKTLTFSQHQARICGQTDAEVRRLLGSQIYEYLVAQALAIIGEERSERRELEDNRALIRARLRLLRQQGPGLGSLFASAPTTSGETIKLETELLENEREIEAMGSAQSVLDAEIELLCQVLEQPQRYVQVEHRQLRLNTMNVVVDETSADLGAPVDFSIAHLTGVPELHTAFVLAHLARVELPVAGMNFENAERAL